MVGKLIGKRFVPVDVNFTSCRKILYLEVKHENPFYADFMIASMLRLWTKCHLAYQDGILNMDAEDIEMLVKWKGAEGDFIKIATAKKTCFMDKESDEVYHVHKWFFHNSYLDPKKREEVSKQKSGAAHSRYFKEEVAVLRGKGIELKDCRWLAKNSKGRVGVDYKHLPAFMCLSGEQFHSRAEFTENNIHQKKEVQNARNNVIIANTKRCAKCDKIHVSTESNLCFKCDKA